MRQQGIKIVYQRNILDDANRLITRLPHGATLRNCLTAFSYPDIGDDYEILVTIDGAHIKAVDWSYVPDDGSYVTIAIVPRYEAIAAAAAYIAAAVEAYAVGAGVSTITAAYIGAAVYYGSMAVMMAAAYMASNMLFNAFSAQPSMAEQGVNNSPTYSWSGAQGNYPYQGGVAPVLYGRMRVVPPRIGMYVETTDGKQYLNMLYLIAGHKVDAIESIRVNQIPIGQYNPLTTQTWTRLGEISQAAIPFFGESTRSDQAVGVKLRYDGWTVRQTDGNAVEGLSVTLNCRRGLGVVSGASLIEAINEVSVEYRRVGDSEWIKLVTSRQVPQYGRLTVTQSRWSGGYRYYEMAGEGFGAVERWGELEAGSTNYADHKEGDAYQPATPVTAKLPTGMGYGTGWVWHWIDCSQKTHNPETGEWVFGADVHAIEIQTMSLSDVPYDNVVLRGAQTSPYVLSVSTPHKLAPGRYEVRARDLNPSSGASPLGSLLDVWWDTLQEWVYDSFEYPGSALLAVRIEASDELSGSVPLIDCIAARDTVDVWDADTSAYVRRPANSHSWASYDVLHNSDYGASESATSFDVPDFARWAAYTRAKGWECNIYIDQQMTAADVLARISSTGAGSTMKLGSRHICIVDSPEETGVQRFLFTPGNVEANSYAEEYLPVMERANRIEITYYDKENEYEKTSLIVKTADADYAGLSPQPVTLDLIGCTSRRHAIQLGNMLLKANRYITMTASWRADVDAVGCRIGDVVEIQVYGAGGRIVSATSNTARLDAKVELTGPSSIVVKRADDVMERKGIASLIVDPAWVAGVAYVVGDIRSAHDTSWECVVPHTSGADFPAGDGRWWRQAGTGVNISGAWQQTPQLHDLYAYGADAEVTRLMRIIAIEKDQDMRRKITAVEYLPQIYNDDMAVTVEIPAPAGVAVRHLAAQESSIAGAFVVALSWVGDAVRWQVYFRVAGEKNWTLAGETTRPIYTVAGLSPGLSYDFCVTVGSNPSAGRVVTRYFHGAPTVVDPGGASVPGKPAAPTKFRAERSGAVLLLTWAAPIEAAYPVTGYHITMNDAPLVSGYAGTSYTYDGQLPAGLYVFALRAGNAYGQISDPATCELRIEADISQTPPQYGDLRGLSVVTANAVHTISWIGSTDPQVIRYDVFAAAAGSAFGTAVMIGSVTGSAEQTDYQYATPYNPDYGRYFIRACYSNGASSIKVAQIDVRLLSAVADIGVTVAEPNIVFLWPRVAEAEKYELDVEYGNVTQRYWVTATTFTIGIPRVSVNVRVRAWSADGRWSRWVEEEASVTGIYNWNEVVNVPIASFAGGTYVNMAWINNNTVQRASLAGGTAAAPWAANVNDSDLFNFIHGVGSVAASNFGNTPANWFRTNWWSEKDAYFESTVYDLGEVHTGRLNFFLTRTVTNNALTVAAIANVLVQYFGGYTIEDLASARVKLAAHIQISTDGLSWSAAENGEWVTMRYCRVRVSVLDASPLTDIRVTAGGIVLDVPDITETGTRVLSGTSGAVTFTKSFRVCNVVICNAAGNARAWATGISKTGFTANCETANQTIYWFAKGY